MKKYLLTLLTLFVILAPNVKAEECVNLYPYEPGTLGFNPVQQINYWAYFGSKQIENLDTSKTYTFYALKDNQPVEKLDFIQFNINSKFYSNVQSVTLSNITSFKASWQYKSYDALMTTDDEIYKELQSWQLWLVEGDTVCIPKTEPDTPVADATLDNFYSIYLDKLGMLVDYTCQNKLILSFIGIILLFVCLEIFLQLFFINGRRRMK